VPDLHSVGADECNEAFAIPKFDIAAVHEPLRLFDRRIVVGAVEYLWRLGNVAALGQGNMLDMLA
jgi:hypothetical protein